MRFETNYGPRNDVDRVARQSGGYGTVKALNTYVMPVVNPNAGSISVRPKNAAASQRTGPRVKRAPNFRQAPRFASRQWALTSKVHAAVHLADQFGPLGHRTRKREPVRDDVVLPLAVGRVAEDAAADIADDAEGPDGLGDQQRRVEIRRVQSEAALVLVRWAASSRSGLRTPASRRLPVPRESSWRRRYRSHRGSSRR